MSTWISDFVALVSLLSVCSIFCIMFYVLCLCSMPYVINYFLVICFQWGSLQYLWCASVTSHCDLWLVTISLCVSDLHLWRFELLNLSKTSSDVPLPLHIWPRTERFSCRGGWFNEADMHKRYAKRWVLHSTMSRLAGWGGLFTGANYSSFGDVGNIYLQFRALVALYVGHLSKVQDGVSRRGFELVEGHSECSGRLSYRRKDGCT